MPAAKSKNKSIVILCDGTSNEIGSDRTHVVRLYGCLERSEKQVVWYDPGVGTLGNASGIPKVARKFKEVLGLAFGEGLSENVLQAYEFLSRNYEKGDKIYLFGFSRGAYTVRELASLIFIIGIMPPYQLNLKGYVYDTLSSINAKEDFGKITMYQRMLERTEVPIEFLGLWDTVSSKFDFSANWFNLKNNPYTSNNPCVKHISHALAIDERRVMFQHQYWKWDPPIKFRTSLWENTNKKKGKPIYQTLNQVWFAGSHCDVGGGFSDEDSQASKVAFEWMLGEAKQVGLALNKDTCDIMLGQKASRSGKTYSKPSPTAQLYNSLSGRKTLSGQKAWWLVELMPQRRDKSKSKLASFTNLTIPLGRSRKILEDEPNVHISVQERMKNDPAYAPKNLPAKERINWVRNKPYK